MSLGEVSRNSPEAFTEGRNLGRREPLRVSGAFGTAPATPQSLRLHGWYSDFSRDKHAFRVTRTLSRRLVPFGSHTPPGAEVASRQAGQDMA